MTRLRHPDGDETSAQVEGHDYVPDDSGAISVDSPDHVPLLQRMGWTVDNTPPPRAPTKPGRGKKADEEAAAAEAKAAEEAAAAEAKAAEEAAAAEAAAKIGAAGTEGGV